MDDPIVCKPGLQRCGDDTIIETCAPTGREWVATECGTHERCVTCSVEEDPTCATGAYCTGPCELAEELPSSAGCEFFATRMLHVFEDQPDGLIVGNPSESDTATVQFYRVDIGKHDEVPVGDPVVLSPGQTYTYLMDDAFVDASQWTMFQSGGIVIVRSDLPVVAYLHSPLTNEQAIEGNKGGAPESSMLLPTSALRQDYVVASFSPFDDPNHPLGNGQPSYFMVIALEDGTNLEWTPRVDTAGSGLPIDPVQAGGTGMVTLNRFDVVRIAASGENGSAIVERDISGAYVHSNKPVWLSGAVRCAYVPVGTRFCDHLQEVMFPLEFWGRRYVAAHAPARGAEPFIWRIYSGADGVTVTTTPQQPGTPVTLGRGEFVEVQVGPDVDFLVDADGPVLPVQYLAGVEATGVMKGDPAMVQAVPVDQFLSRYAFVTGINYPENYVQVIRPADGPDVLVDGVVVSGYRQVQGFEVADVAISEGAHLAESSGAFGIIQVGYGVQDPNAMVKGEAAAYAYPGGMKADTLFIP
ncbi:MAG: hypothetical protein D6705_17270 [Deltaproteobacteria bacterium]|nr:MAG: hypothetical protein D6705_17270 [Deltaproteobacteria bacterium]